MGPPDGSPSVVSDKRAVVLLSGGLDSATVLAIARSEGFSVATLAIDYGQRHRDELAAAARVAGALGAVEHRTVRIDLRTIGGSALTSDTLSVPKDSVSPIAGQIPITYVPARNTIFLSLALGLAEVTGAFDVFFGANALDYSGYPDCRPAFVAAFEALANVATKAAVENRGGYRIHAPLIAMSKAEIIHRGLSLGVDFSITHSCYDPIDGLACGRCDSCSIRRAGFEQAGVADPTRYAREGAPS
jgi:7-cyano-7-deazaguanine synthase